MLTGPHVTLRPTREADLKLLYDVHLDLSNRGDYFPLQLVSESQFIKDFRDTGFMTPERGTLLIIDRDDRIVGASSTTRPSRISVSWSSVTTSSTARSGARGSPARRSGCSHGTSSTPGR